MSYSNKELKYMTKHLLSILDDPDVSMATVPRKEGYPELAVIKKDIFMDIETENQQLKKWIHMAGQVIVNLDVNSSTLGSDIRNLLMMAVDAGDRFFGMDKDRLEAVKKDVMESLEKEIIDISQRIDTAISPDPNPIFIPKEPENV